MDTPTQANVILATSGRGFHEITDKVAAIVESSGCRTGVVQVFVSHTSCSLLITEHADPAVRRDLERWMAHAVPDGDAMFEHDAEGPDDMPAHVRTTLTGVHVCAPVSEGRLQLGTWQGIYLWEHRQVPHRRRVTVTVLG